MSDEKLRILEMIQEGKISASEGMELMEALSENESPAEGPAPELRSRRSLHIRVKEGENVKVNVNVPLNLVRALSKVAGSGLNFIPGEAREEMQKKGIDLSGLDLDELVRLIDSGEIDGRLVDIDTDESGEGRVQVEIYID